MGYKHYVNLFCLVLFLSSTLSVSVFAYDYKSLASNNYSVSGQPVNYLWLFNESMGTEILDWGKFQNVNNGSLIAYNHSNSNYGIGMFDGGYHCQNNSILIVKDSDIGNIYDNYPSLSFGFWLKTSDNSQFFPFAQWYDGTDYHFSVEFNNGVIYYHHWNSSTNNITTKSYTFNYLDDEWHHYYWQHGELAGGNGNLGFKIDGFQAYNISDGSFPYISDSDANWTVCGRDLGDEEYEVGGDFWIDEPFIVDAGISNFNEFFNVSGNLNQTVYDSSYNWELLYKNSSTVFVTHGISWQIDDLEYPVGTVWDGEDSIIFINYYGKEFIICPINNSYCFAYNKSSSNVCDSQLGLFSYTNDSFVSTCVSGGSSGVDTEFYSYAMNNNGTYTYSYDDEPTVNNPEAWDWVGIVNDTGNIYPNSEQYYVMFGGYNDSFIVARDDNLTSVDDWVLIAKSGGIQDSGSMTNFYYGTNFKNQIYVAGDGEGKLHKYNPLTDTFCLVNNDLGTPFSSKTNLFVSDANPPIAGSGYLYRIEDDELPCNLTSGFANVTIMAQIPVDTALNGFTMVTPIGNYGVLENYSTNNYGLLNLLIVDKDKFEPFGDENTALPIYSSVVWSDDYAYIGGYNASTSSGVVSRLYFPINLTTESEVSEYFNITSDITNYSMDYRNFGVSFGASDNLSDAFALLFEPDCSTLVENITANVFSDYVVDSSNLISSSITYNVWSDVGLDLDGDSVNDKVSSCRAGFGRCPVEYEDKSIIFNLSSNGQAFAFYYKDGVDYPEALVLSHVPYYGFKSPIYSINGSFFGFVDFNGSTSSSWTLEPNSINVYKVHLKTSEPKFNFSLFSNNEFGLTYCVKAFGFNGYSWNETSFINLTTKKYVVPENQPLFINYSVQECNVDGSLTGDSCIGNNEYFNNTFDYCWDGDYNSGYYINDMWTNQDSFVSGSNIIVTANTPSSFTTFRLFDYQKQKWTDLGNGIKTGNNHTVSFTIDDIGAYVVRASPRYIVGDSSEVCTYYNDNDDLLFWVLNQDLNYSENVSYGFWNCNVDGSSVGGSCSGFREESYSGSTNATIDNCGDSKLNLSGSGYIENIYVDAIQVYADDSVNVTVEYWSAGSNLYFNTYYYKDGVWNVLNSTTLSGLSINQFGNYSFVWKPSVAGIENLRISLGNQNIIPSGDGCACDYPYNSCNIRDHDDIPFKTFLNPIPQVLNISLVNSTNETLSLMIKENVQGEGELLIYENDCLTLIDTKNITSQYWDSPYWFINFSIYGLRNNTEYCFKAVMNWNDDFNSSYYNFFTANTVMPSNIIDTSVGNLSCFYNDEPYYGVNGFDVLCYIPDIDSYSCYGKLEEDGRVIQVTPERKVLKNGVEFNRFQTDSNNVIIEFSRKNLKNDVPVMMYVYCSNGSDGRYFGDVITPKIMTPYFVEDVLTYGVSYTRYIIIFLGLLIVLLGALSFFYYMIKRSK